MRDVVVISSCRTAIGRAKGGNLKDTRPDDMMGFIMKAALERAGDLDLARIDDVVIGTAFPEGEQGMNMGKVVAALAGLPDTVPAMTINRFCSSGLQSLAQAATSIMSGWTDMALTGGVESMTIIPMGGQKPAPNPWLMANAPEVYCPMGVTAENVADRFGVTREDQDAFAISSNTKALAAIESGKFKDEIEPMPTRAFQDGAWQDVLVDTDEGPRPPMPEKMKKLRSPFKQGGSVTAANASQMSNGAAANLIAAREVAEELGLPILATLKSYKVVGVPADIMGVGPLYAIPPAVEMAGLTLDDIDVFEINEAFASQALYCVRELGIDPDKVNPNGGAIALGHPLGATGARMVSTLLYEMKRRGARYGVVSMCIGGGMGAAAVFELEM